MADISILSRLVNALQRNIDVSQNALVVGSLKVGSSSPVEITKAIATKLIQMQSVADADGTYDTRYHTKTVLASQTTGQGASLIGIEDAGSMFTATTVEGALAELAGSIGSGAASGITYDNSSSGLSATNVQDAIDEVEARVDATETVANAAIPATQKGAANGVATLDGGGKIPASQLPNSVMELQGFWNASSNTPTLVNGTGNPGDVWEVDTAGSVDFGDGSISFAVGDWAVYAADGKWHKSINSNEVTSVNGQTGTVSLTADNIPEGTTNKYFTDEKAQDAVGSIVASGATVELFYNDSTPAIYAEVINNSIGAAKLTTGVADQDSITGGNGTALAVQHAPKIVTNETAGESLADDVTFAVRMAMDGETAGRIYKADADATTDNRFFVVGLARKVGGASAGDPVAMTSFGTHDLGANDTPFSSTDIGKPVYLTSAGGFSVTAPSSSNQAVMKIGMVETTTKIRMVGMNLHGVN